MKVSISLNLLDVQYINHCKHIKYKNYNEIINNIIKNIKLFIFLFI